MNVEEIKRGITRLTESEQAEITAFLFHLRHSSDADYQNRVGARLADRDPSHWLTPEEFERQFEAR